MLARRRLAVIPILAIVASAVLIALSMIAWNARPATGIVIGYAINVTTPNDNTISGDSLCSLREAILGANSGHNTIDCGPGPITGIYFDIGTGIPAINVDVAGQGPLPTITKTVTIDGHSAGKADRVELHGDGGGDGLTISGANAAGSSISHLVINNFSGSGIVVFADNVTVTGSFIGTNATGTAAAPNARGIYTGGANTHIGGTAGTSLGGACTGDCNLISGNGTDIYLSASNAPLVEGNFIGSDVTGTTSFGTGGGIHNQSTFAVIGGTAAGAGNLIKYMDTWYHSVTIQGNRIGTNSAGTAALPNAGGIYLKSAGNSVVGGSPPGAGNLISGSTSYGINVDGSNAVAIQDNLIGTKLDGTSALPNSLDGVYIHPDSSDGGVGGVAAGQGNTIAFNGGAGVHTDGPSSADAIRGNSIHDNAGKGIANTNGGNTEPPPPVISGANPVHGTASCSTCVIDVYSDAADEGKIFEGSVTADGSGNWVFNGSVNGPHVTAVMVKFPGLTSEFSAPFVVPSPTPSPSPSPSPTPTPTHTPTPTPTHTASAHRVQGDVNCDGMVDDLDFRFLIEFAAELNHGTTPGACPDVGVNEAITGFKWGDVNCDGFVNALDALYVLVFKVQLHTLPSPPQSCFPIGSVIT